MSQKLVAIILPQAYQIIKEINDYRSGMEGIGLQPGERQCRSLRPASMIGVLGQRNNAEN